MKATTYISNPLHKVNTKNLYLRKYIYILLFIAITISNIKAQDFTITAPTSSSVFSANGVTLSNYTLASKTYNNSTTNLFKVNNTSSTNSVDIIKISSTKVITKIVFLACAQTSGSSATTLYPACDVMASTDGTTYTKIQSVSLPGYQYSKEITINIDESSNYKYITIVKPSSGSNIKEGDVYSLSVWLAASCSGTPSFSTDLSTTEVKYCKGATSVASLGITASNASSYQWYSASDATSTGTTISGATTTTYTPSVTSAGTTYYYCVATCGANSTASSRTPITVSDATISGTTTTVAAGATITLTGATTGGTWSTGDPTVATVDATGVVTGVAAGTATITYTINGCTSTQVVTVTCATVGGTAAASNASICSGSSSSLSLSGQTSGATIQWQSASSSAGTYTDITGATASPYTVSPTATTYYRAAVTYNGCTSYSSVASVALKAATAITTQPTAASYTQYATANALTVAASGEGTLSYQWYSNGTTNSTTGGSAVSTTASYTPDVTATGTTYYYCVVTGACGSITSNAVAITVTAAASGTVPVPSTPTNGCNTITWTNNGASATSYDVKMCTSVATDMSVTPNTWSAFPSDGHGYTAANYGFNSSKFYLGTTKNVAKTGTVGDSTHVQGYLQFNLPDGVKTLSVAFTSNPIHVEYSLDGGTAWTATTSYATSSSPLSLNINSNNPAIIKIVNDGSATSSSGTWAYISSITTTNYSGCTTTNATSTSYTPTVTPNTTYYVSVRNDVNSTPSNWSSVLTYVSAPDDVSGLIASNSTSGQIGLSWTAPSSATGVTYTVKYKKSSDATWTTFATGLTATTSTITGLDALTSYDYQVISVNSSCSSSGVTGNILTIDTPPAVPVPTSNTPTTAGFNVTWPAVTGAEGYEVKICSIDTTATSTNYSLNLPVTTANGFTTVPSGMTGTCSSTGVMTSSAGAYQSSITQNGFTISNGKISTDCEGFLIKGSIVTPTLLSAKTLTFKAAGYGTNYPIKVYTSTDNGASWVLRDIVTCANIWDGTSSSLTSFSIPINEAFPVKIKLASYPEGIAEFITDIKVLECPLNCTTKDVGHITSYDVNSLNPNSQYYYSVRSYKTSGASPLYSDWSTITLNTKQLTLPNAPICSAATVTDVISGFNANWSAPAPIGDASYSYKVQLKNGSGVAIGSPVSVSSFYTSYNFDASIVSPNTTYNYDIWTVNNAGTSSISNCGPITTPATVNVTLRIQPSGSGSIIVGNDTISSNSVIKVNTGNNISLSSIPATSYGFLRWILGKQTLSTSYPLSITTNTDTTITAIFAAQTCASYALTSSIPSGWVTGGSTSPSISSSALRFNYNGGTVTTTSETNSISSISFQAKTNGSYSTSDTKSTDFGVYLLTSDGSTIQVFYKNFARSVSTDASVATYTINGLSSYGPGAKILLKSIKKDGSSSSHDILITNLNICVSPETTPPTITFVPTPSSTNVPVTKTLTIKSSEILYQYQSGGSVAAVSDLSTLISNGDLTLEKLTLVSGTYKYVSVPFSATLVSGDSIQVKPSTSMDYSTQYKLTINNVCDASGNMIENYSQKTTFTTEEKPTPLIKVEEISTTSGGTTSSSTKTYTTEGTANMGTIITDGATITKKFRITNQGNGSLDLTSLSLVTTSSIYSVSSLVDKNNASISSLSTTDTAYFTVSFSPGSTSGTYADSIYIHTNDANLCPDGTGSASCKPFVLNLTGIKALFVLPYTYESGCTDPIATSTELKQDYSSIIDIPSEITLEGAAKLVPSYEVYQSEGACVANGNSALRVGSAANRLKITIDNNVGVGQVDIKWCASGYRKVKIYTDANTYVQSPTFLEGGKCYSNSTVMNLQGSSVTFYIEFDGNATDLMTTLYYLHITPYNAELKSSSKDIVSFNTGVTGEVDRIYDDVIFVTYPSDYTGSLTTITPTIGLSSSKATVSPKSGTTNSTITKTDSSFVYTVTAEDGQTKQYNVYVDKAPNYSGCYADSVTYSLPMDSANQTIQVLEISNSTGCVVPVSGNGSSYTIYYLTKEDKPVEGYKISGPSVVCIGTEATYTLSNAPASNNPLYTWNIEDHGVGFKMVSKPNDKNLVLRAPNKIDSTTTISLNITIDLEFTDARCAQLTGGDTIQVRATKVAPTSISGITTGCVSNGKLILKAYGSEGATSYNWDFIPSTLNSNIITQGADSIILNVGSYASDIYAAVNTQNGCGITKATDSVKVNYGTNQTTWTGKQSSDWSDSRNWTAQVPKSCTNVIIPDVSASGVNYPTISATGECNYITFKPNAAVLGLQNLTYNRAYVQLELERNKWYTLTAPLKNMYSGDYYFSGGAPVSYMRLFDTENPDNKTKPITGEWTTSFASLKVNLAPGTGFAYKIDPTVWNYPNGYSLTYTNKTLTFPRMNSDSSLITKYIPYSAFTGKPLTLLATSLDRYDTIAYRFAMEKNKKLNDVTVTLKAGKNLVGNPLMTHLDINKLLSDNSGSVKSYIYLWNGSTFPTFDAADSTWTDPTYSKGALLAPMQSFIVNAASDGALAIKCNNDFAADNSKSNKLRAASTTENLMYIQTNNGTSTSSTAISRNSSAVNSYGSEDIDKLFTSETTVPDVYTIADGVALNKNKFSTIPFTTPVAIKTTKYGNITFTFTGADSFGDEVEVSLIDTKAKDTIDLKQQSTYNFALDSTNAEGTLFVQFKNATVTSTTNAMQTNESAIQIYTKDNNVIRVISSPSNLIKDITIMDETGKKIVEKTALNTALFDMVMNNGDHVYIVRAVTEKEVKIAKVLIK